MRHALKILYPTILLLAASAVWGQEPVDPNANQNPAPAVQEAEDTRPIGVRLSEAAAEFTRAIQAAERGETDVEDAQAEVDRLEAELVTATASTQTASDSLDGLHDETRTAGEAVIGLIQEFLATLPD